MSNSELNKTKNIQNENAQKISITQENTYTIDMELVQKEIVTPESLNKAENKDYDIIIENKEHSNEIKEEDIGMFSSIPEVKVHIICPTTAKQKNTIKEFYNSMVEFRDQQRLARQIRRQKQSPAPPLQTVMVHDDLNKSSDTLQAPGYSPVPGSQGTGYPQKEDQEYLERLRGGSDGGDRSLFVGTVMTITFIMLAFTSLFVATVVMTDLKDLFIKYGLMLFISSAIVLTTINCFFAYSNCARRLPCNFVLLFLTLFAMSIFAATASSKYKTDLIFQAVLATAIVVGICSIIASLGFDFTSYIIYIIVFSLVLGVVCIVFFGIRLVTGESMRMLHLGLLLLMTGLQCAFLIVQLQMILGGQTIELNEEDYVLGAYYLYTSIVNIFINLLNVIGEFDD